MLFEQTINSVSITRERATVILNSYYYSIIFTACMDTHKQKLMQNVHHAVGFMQHLGNLLTFSCMLLDMT